MRSAGEVSSGFINRDLLNGAFSLHRSHDDAVGRRGRAVAGARGRREATAVDTTTGLTLLTRDASALAVCDSISRLSLYVE